ncbi:MAG: glycosyltransferase family 4 protein [Thermoplasmata archaeon]
MHCEGNVRIGKILLISLDDPTKRGGVGGKHVHINLLMRGLREEGIEVSIATVREDARFKLFHRYPGAVYRRLIRDKGKRFHNYTSQYVAQLRRNLSAVRDEPSILNPHDVLSCNLANEVFRGRIPLVMTLHGYYTMEAVSNREILPGSPIYELYLDEESRACDAAWRIVCVDSRIRDYLVRKLNVPMQRIAVLPNAIDTTTFMPVTRESMLSQRRAIGIPIKDFVIFCPRRLVPKNGVKYAALAMISLKRRIPNALLVIAGEGPDRAEIERIVEEEKLHECVRLVGNVPHDEILAYYQACDVVIIPSITSEGVEEATSLSMLEGMACGKAVIVTDVGGLKETVKHGDTGIIVSQANPDAIASELERLYREPKLAQNMGSSARKLVERHHSYVAHARRMMAEYERAALDGGR